MSDPREIPARFWDKVSVDPSGCWLWTAFKSEKGYGQFGVREQGQRRTVRAHRYAYESIVGPIPSGLTLDHLCRVRHCVNPAHLEKATVRVNVLRGDGITARQLRAPHCAKGHPYTTENTSLLHGWRICRVCRKANNQRKRANRRLRAMSA